MDDEGVRTTMKRLIQKSAWAEALSARIGGSAVVWMYHASHRKLALRISHPSQDTDVYVAGIGCSSMSGPFAWSNASVCVEEGNGGVAAMRVRDVRAGFELQCREVFVLSGPRGEYDESFRGFVGDADGD